MQGLSTSPSRLIEIAKSPAHYKAKYIDKTVEQTDAMREGQWLHMAVLEPEKFYATHICAPDISDYPGCLVTLKDMQAWLQGRHAPYSGKKEELIKRIKYMDPEAKIYDEIEENIKASGREIISNTVWNRIHNMKTAVIQHEWINNALKGGRKEERFEWVHKPSETLIRFKLDWLNLNTNDKQVAVVMDIKSAPSATYRDFMYKVHKEKLHLQAAVYVDAINELFGVKTLYVWGVVEKKSPFICEAYAADNATIEIGRRLYEKSLRTLHKCTSENVWPGYSGAQNVINMGLPDWAYEETVDNDWEGFDADELE